ncbi:signal peptide protein [Paenibacillus amylolyticus]
MLDVYLIAILITLAALMIGLGQWASLTINKGSDQG